MTAFNSIDLHNESQVIFDILSQFNEESLFYIRDRHQNVIHVSQPFFHMVNIPSNSLTLLNNYPKLKTLVEIEECIFKSKESNDFFYAFMLRPDLYFLFYVKSKFFVFNNNEYTVTFFKKFSDFFMGEKELSSINVIDEYNTDDGFPVDDYKDINPVFLTYSQSEKNEEIVPWYLVWFFLTGRSIRWIADFSCLNKKQVENLLGKFYTNSGVLNQKNLRAISRKYNWCNFLDKKTIELINSNALKGKKIFI